MYNIKKDDVYPYYWECTGMDGIVWRFEPKNYDNPIKFVKILEGLNPTDEQINKSHYHLKNWLTIEFPDLIHDVRFGSLCQFD